LQNELREVEEERDNFEHELKVAKKREERLESELN
jgi:hypothetical protein